MDKFKVDVLTDILADVSMDLQFLNYRVRDLNERMKKDHPEAKALFEDWGLSLVGVSALLLEMKGRIDIVNGSFYPDEKEA